MDWTLGKVLQNVKYNGGLLRCPLKGNLSMRIDDIALNKVFPLVPLLPSGHYRIDRTYTEGNRSNIYAKTQLFLEISDNRLERY